MVDGDDGDDGLSLTAVVVVSLLAPIVCFADVVVIFCCFGAATLAAGTFVVVGGDDTAVGDVDGIAAAVVVLLFTVLGIPHMRASVVLTTLRLVLPGAHIIVLTRGDIVVLGDTVGGDNGVGEDDGC